MKKKSKDSENNLKKIFKTAIIGIINALVSWISKKIFVGDKNSNIIDFISLFVASLSAIFIWIKISKQTNKKTNIVSNKDGEFYNSPQIIVSGDYIDKRQSFYNSSPTKKSFSSPSAIIKKNQKEKRNNGKKR